MQQGDVFAAKWRVIRLIGQGGMGAVYEVEHVENRGRRALKLMHVGMQLRDPRAIERFKQEAMVGNQLGSRYVADVFDNGVEDGAPWLLMELLRGETLASLLARERMLSPGALSTVLAQVCDALGRAHAMGIVHRDLKPDNVFLHWSGSPGDPVIVKLIDFGIAKILDDSLVRSTRLAGTVGWMAPEQGLGQNPVAPTGPRWTIGPPTDVWALGLLAYRALAGKDYWDDIQSAEAYLLQIVSGRVVPASVRAREQAAPNQQLWPAFDAWFGGCVAVEPGARYPNATAAWQALQPLLGPPAPLPAATGPSGGARPPSGVEAFGPRPNSYSYSQPPVVTVLPSTPGQYATPVPVSQPAFQGATPNPPTNYTPYAPAPSPGQSTQLGGAPPYPYPPQPPNQALTPAAQKRTNVVVASAIGGSLALLLLVLLVYSQSASWRGRQCKADTKATAANAPSLIESCTAACASKAGESCVLRGDLIQRFDKSPGAASTATDAYSRACTAGLAAGCRRLGDLKELQNQDDALDLYQKACASGDEEACVEHGALLELGHGKGGGASGVTEASKAYADACISNDALGCAYQAFLFAQGRGVTRDDKRAANMLAAAAPALQKDCTQGRWRQCVAWATAEQILDDKPGLASALAQLDDACSAGYATACTNLGAATLVGLGVDASVPHGVELLRQACDAGELAGCNDLATVQSGVPFTLRTGTRGAFVLELSCTDAIQVGCADWGATYTAGGATDQAAAMAGWQKACDGGELVACVNWGGFACRGVGRATCDAAPAHFERACEGGNGGGCGQLATMYVKGRRVAVDTARGNGLMTRACQQGELDACGSGDASGSITKVLCEDKHIASACTVYADGLAQGTNGLTVDVSRAETLLRGAASGADERRYAPALSKLGDLYQREHRATDAMASYRAACDQHAPGGCGLLALAMVQQSPASRADAIAVAKRACDADSRDDCFFEARIGLEAAATSDKSAPLTLMTSVCREGEGYACFLAAGFYKTGAVGVARDTAMATKLYVEACDRGVQQACPKGSTPSAPSSSPGPAAANAPQCGEWRQLEAQCGRFRGHCDDLLTHKGEFSNLTKCQNVCQMGMVAAARSYGFTCH